jgi:hypothetical protein
VNCWQKSAIDDDGLHSFSLTHIVVFGQRQPASSFYAHNAARVEDFASGFEHDAQPVARSPNAD